MASKKEQPKEKAQPKPAEAAIVQVPTQLEIAAPPSPEEVLKAANRQIEIFRGYVKLVAKFVRPEDVLVFGEEVYLPAKPCQDILSWARINIKPHWPVFEHRYDSPDGEFIEFEISATIRDGSGREVDVIGNRSTRDEFFGIAGKEYLCPDCKGKTVRKKLRDTDQYESNVCVNQQCPKNGKWVKPEVVIHYLPLYDVDIPSVRQAAVTNLWNHALKAVGLRPTLQDLQEAGMDISKVKRVDFSGKKADKPAGGTGNANRAEPSRQPAGTQQPGASQPQNTGHAPQTPGPMAPPKANIQPMEDLVMGPMDEMKLLKTKGGQPFVGIVVSGQKLTLFDNKVVSIDGKKNEPLFDILGRIPKKAFGRFIVRRKGEYLNIVTVLQLGAYEWEPDGTSVLRRDTVPNQQEPLPGIDDSDVPF